MKRKNIDKIQKDFRSKLGVVKANRHRKKLGQGKKNKQDRWGGLPRKEGRKAARKQKKEKMNAAYLSRFSVHHIHKVVNIKKKSRFSAFVFIELLTSCNSSIFFFSLSLS